MSCGCGCKTKTNTKPEVKPTQVAPKPVETPKKPNK